jgi:carbonic anhydrase
MPTPKLLAGLAEAQERFQKNREFYERLASQGQHPQVLLIACSDSRVSPELITSATAGELFVTRNIANIVPPFGTGEMGIGAVIEYAVLHLKVAHILILGHTDCGGIRALAAPPDWSREPHIARWIEHARPAQTKVEAAGVPEDERHLATVRENVLLQLEHLRSYDPVREAEKAGRLTLHGLVYHLEAGMFDTYDPETRRWGPLELT